MGAGGYLPHWLFASWVSLRLRVDVFLYFSLTLHPFVVMFCLLLSPDLSIVLIESLRLVARGDIDVIKFSV